jgi:hypothetical protein
MAYTAFLLWIGFVSNFQIDRKVALKMIGILYAIFFVFWIWGLVNSSSRWERSWNSEHIEAPEVELGK